MFGYVKPLTPELKVREYNLFRSYYCGLCFHIKKRFGNIPRMALNYDMTFLGFLLDSLSNEKLDISKSSCLVHPLNKNTIIKNNKALNYAAEMNISLFYYKLIDDIKDDGDLKSKLGATILSTYKNKFSKEVSFINEEIRIHLNQLNKLEEEKSFNSIDEISHPFSEIVGKIIKYYPYKLKNDSKQLRDILYKFGYSLGKWIYVIDALDDLKTDMENNKFNPIDFLYNKKNKTFNEFFPRIIQRIEFTILNSGATCLDCLENLNIQKNKEILKNIIELGMMDKYASIITPSNNSKNTKI